MAQGLVLGRADEAFGECEEISPAPLLGNQQARPLAVAEIHAHDRQPAWQPVRIDPKAFHLLLLSLVGHEQATRRG